MSKKLLLIVMIVSLFGLVSCSEENPEASGLDGGSATNGDNVDNQSMLGDSEQQMPFTTAAFEDALTRFDATDVCSLTELIVTFPSNPQTEEEADTGLQLYVQLFEAMVPFLENEAQVTAFEEAIDSLKNEIIGSGEALDFVQSGRMAEEWNTEQLDAGSAWIESRIQECFNPSMLEDVLGSEPGA